MPAFSTLPLDEELELCARYLGVAHVRLEAPAEDGRFVNRVGILKTRNRHVWLRTNRFSTGCSDSTLLPIQSTRTETWDVKFFPLWSARVVRTVGARIEEADVFKTGKYPIYRTHTDRFAEEMLNACIARWRASKR